LEQRLSKRLDCDKIVFAPRLNHSQINALRSTQTADAIRLQQLYRAIRYLEASIAAKRQYLATKRSAQFVSRHKRKAKVARVVEKLAAAEEHRSLREMQNLLFKIKRQYRAAHKRYAQIHGFNSYANRSTIQFAHRQQNAL
jgi:ribosomal protein L22